jgi:sulfite reductase (NADPH) flavoprotein alpha-component
MNTSNRNNPLDAYITHRRRLTPEGDEKQTFHLELMVDPQKLSYKVGDSVGIYGRNSPNLVISWLLTLQATGNEEIICKQTGEKYTLEHYLSTRVNLTRLNSALTEALGVDSPDPLQEPLDLLKRYPAKIDLQTTCNCLSPLLPRFYSIASSPAHRAGQLDLMVAHLRYQYQNQPRYGVASHFLCELAQIGTTPIPLYLQPTRHFTLPVSLQSPLIMIGPGTGVAPFRAFMQERSLHNSRSRAWLFFGERHVESHFYYATFWEEMKKNGDLLITTAFSRDQPEKIYVQHRIIEHAKALWEWIEEGAHIYICGNADKMARAVETSFLNIFQTEGGHSLDSAKLFLIDLRKQKRYLTDVY